MGAFDLPSPGPAAGLPATGGTFDLPPQPAYQQPGGAEHVDYGVPWGDAQERERGDRELERVSTQAREEEGSARRSELEQKYGIGETVTSQFARGALDALLAPGALLGVAAQTAGEGYDAKWLADFGRDLGRASSGKSAVEALGFVMGGGGMGGAERADLARQRVEEQEEARPMLSSLSRMAGQAFTAVAGGGGAAAEMGAAGNIALNATLGAASGAQQAYEKSAPIRDVLTSAAVGGLLGGAISGTAEAVAYGARKLPKLGEVFSEKLQKFADESEVKAWAGSGKKFWKSMSPERVERVATKLRGLEHASDDEARVAILDSATKTAGEDLSTVERAVQEAGIEPDGVTLFDKIQAQAEKLRGSTQDGENLANRIETQFAPLKRKLEIREIDPATGEEVVTGYRNPTFTELREAKTMLGSSKDEAIRKGETFAGKEFSKLYGSLAQSLDEAAESAGPGVIGVWKNANETYHDLITIQRQVQDRMASAMSNRHFSPTDYFAGMTGFLHAANPLAAGASALGGMVAHKALREGGRAIFATMANRFARTVSKLKMPPDAGTEAQEVLGFMARTRSFAEDMAERAGENPAAREAASDAAKNVAAGVAAERAGALDEAAWSRGLSPMQKVLYRSQILDRASSDLSAEATRLTELHPVMPAELDPQRVAKLAKDATGPDAIGGVQNTVRELLETTPNSPTGATAGVALRQLQDSLQTADVAGAMLKAHAATKTLEQLAKHTTDEPSRNFAERAVIDLRDKLGSDAFGRAGREYSALSARPPEFLEGFTDKDRVREALRGMDADGSLTRQMLEAQQRVAAAHDAAFKLAGQARPADLAKQLTKGRKLAESIEDATTLDGRAMSSFFDVANRAGVYTAGKMLHTQDVGEHTVRETLSEKVDQVAPMLKDAAGISQKRYRPGVVAASSVASRKATDDPQAQYDKRIKTLIDITQDPSKIQGGMYASISPDVGQKMAQLLADAPKADKPLIGQAGTKLSRSDLQLFDDMWEATTRPLSVFDDFRAGRVSYDKSQYAWKQYPGLQQASQAGMLDLLTHQMSEEEVAKIPHAIITQIDDLLGFGGMLSQTTDPAFAARMTQMYQPAPNKAQQGGTLDTPKAEPTYTQRIAGAGT